MAEDVNQAVSPEQVAEALRGRVAGEVLADPFSRTAYATAACIYQIMPLAVVVPKDASDVVAAVRVAAELGIPVTARGAGSGVCGQALGRGVIVDFTKYMTRVEVDAEARRVRVGPGAVTGKVNEALAGHGLMLGPDPSSEAFCTIGGNLGNNASGARGIRYGSTKDYVLWLDVVLADGSRARLEPMHEDDPRLAEMAARDDLIGRIVSGTRRLVNQHADLIRRYEPHTGKNSAGYNLFDVLRDGIFDLTRLVVGSEGTLAVVVDAGIGVVPRPSERASVLLWFSDLERAAEAAHHLLELGPSACEIMEKRFLDIVRTDGSVPGGYLPKEADTILLVEQLSDSRDENEAFVVALKGRIIDDLGLAFGSVEACDPQEQERLWQVRKGAVQILHRLPGPKRITPFVEDVTVPPDRLVEYVRGLRAIFDRHEVDAAIYGHAGDSNLHARPILDTREPEDLERIRAIAGEVARLTVDLGGMISCEHGDGLTRSAYLRLQFGDLYDVMREVKRLWDPAGRLNPGKVVTDERQIHLDDLRMGPDYARRPTGEAFDREPWATELERCHGCGTCLAYCPVYLVTGDEQATPRAKANLLRAAIAGDLDLDDLDDQKMRAVADLCYNCKTCLVECPSNVNIPGLVLKHKEHLAGRGYLSLRDRMALQVRPMGRVGSLMAPVSNWLMRRPLVRRLMAPAGGIAEKAALPAFARKPLKEGLAVEAEQPACKIAYFAGCFELFNEPRIGRAALRVLDALGCTVLIPDQKCCGVAKISAGDVRGMLKDMRYNLGVLASLVQAGFTVASGCPSCVLTLTEDYPDLSDQDERARLVARHTCDVHDLLEKGDSSLFRPPEERDSPLFRKRLAYHAPCHLRAAGRGDRPRRLLERLLGLEFVLANDTCCGMGGTYGLKTRNYETSRKIAEPVMRRILESGAEAVVTSCGMCRTQLAHGTGLPVYHPMELLAAALGEKTGEVIRPGG